MSDEVSRLKDDLIAELAKVSDLTAKNKALLTAYDGIEPQHIRLFMEGWKALEQSEARAKQENKRLRELLQEYIVEHDKMAMALRSYSGSEICTCKICRKARKALGGQQ